jgi:hypothetical protein
MQRDASSLQEKFFQGSLSGVCFVNKQSHFYAALYGRKSKKSKVMSPSSIMITDNQREILTHNVK